MASEFEAFQRELMAKIAVSYGMTFDQWTGVVGLPETDTEWYRRIGAQLDDLPDDCGLWIARFKLAWHPGRYVWVDRHLRVWRSDDAGRLTTRQHLRAPEEINGAVRNINGLAAEMPSEEITPSPPLICREEN